MNSINLKTKLVIVVVLSLMFVGCSSDDTKPTTGGSNPFPFVKVGNEWEYENNNDPDDCFKSKIVSKNGNVFRIELEKDGMSLPGGDYWFANNTYWKKSTDASGNGGFVIFYKNYFVGQEWEFDHYGSKTGEVVSVSETVTVPAGTFNNCIKVQISIGEGGIDYYYYWIDKNVGIIMVEEGSHIEKLKSKNF